jgi:four helix bundle protein
MNLFRQEVNRINNLSSDHNEVLELAVQLFKDIYTFTDTWPTSTTQQFSQVMDIRRAAMTIPNGVTEGLNREQDEEAIEFLSHSQELLGELETHLLAARNREDLAAESFGPLLQQIEKVKTRIQDIRSRLAASK